MNNNLTASVAQRLAQWALDEGVSGSIPRRTNLGTALLCIGFGLDVLDHYLHYIHIG